MASADVQAPTTALPSTLVVEGPKVGGLASSDQVEAVLNYFKENEDGSPPAPVYVDRPETHASPTEPHTVNITNIAGREAEFTLDRHGFQVHSHVSRVRGWDGNEDIKAVYYPETEQLLKDVTGASKVFIFDHTIRQGTQQGRGSAEAAIRGPVQRVHIDQSFQAALSRVPHHLPAEEASELLKGRVQIINVWRSLKTVERDPLAVAEAHSVSGGDLVPIGLIYPGRNGETLSVRYSPAHRWYYKRGLTPDEVLLIKCFDSKDDGRARAVPHTAFTDPTSKPDAPARESIEVRCLVFHPEDRA